MIRKRILGYSFKLYLLDLVFFAFVSLPAIRLEQRLNDRITTRGWNQAAISRYDRDNFLLLGLSFCMDHDSSHNPVAACSGAEPPSTDEKKRRYFRS